MSRPSQRTRSHDERRHRDQHDSREREADDALTLGVVQAALDRRGLADGGFNVATREGIGGACGVGIAVRSR